jgi:hypothetical protein
MVQLDKRWIRWGIVFVVITLVVEGVMLRVPEASSVKISVGQAWALPVLFDRSQLATLSEVAATHIAWGVTESTDTTDQKPVSWQLKGIVKAGAKLLALVAVDNKMLRVKVGDQVLDSKIEIIQAGGITVSEIDEKGDSQTRFVKIHR